jgi:rhodanese-related sulfurtransferase
MNLDPQFDRHIHIVADREAAALVARGVTVLDVRTPGEFTGLGHIPGARLLPVDISAAAPAILDETAAVLVCCEHAVRSRFTARLLAQAGFSEVYELAGGMAAWSGPREYEDAPVSGPSAWLLDNADLLRDRRRVLDVACGAGRHALLLASAGFEVTAIDRDTVALDRLRAQAARLELPMRIETIDLEAPDVQLEPDHYDVIVVTRYLHRPLFPQLIQALAPKGLLIYETFLEQQAVHGHPKNPAFLLKVGELSELVRPLEVLRTHEGETDGTFFSAVIARRS